MSISESHQKPTPSLSLLRCYQLEQKHTTTILSRESIVTTDVESRAAAEMATSSKEATFPTAQHRENLSEQPTSSPLADSSSTAYARVIFFVFAAALCHALAGRTSFAMSSTSQPWWLGQAAGLVIHKYSTDLVNHTEASGGRCIMLRIIAIGLGWTLDHKILDI